MSPFGEIAYLVSTSNVKMKCGHNERNIVLSKIVPTNRRHHVRAMIAVVKNRDLTMMTYVQRQNLNINPTFNQTIVPLGIHSNNRDTRQRILPNPFQFEIYKSVSCFELF